MVRITGQRRPDRGTIGRSGANRDYRMSTYDSQGLTSDTIIRATKPRMGQANSPLRHHFHEISKAEPEPQIPANAEDDDLPVEMTALEKIIYAQHLDSLPPKASFQQKLPRFCRLHQSLCQGRGEKLA
jgi:hypothetical protein